MKIRSYLHDDAYKCFEDFQHSFCTELTGDDLRVPECVAKYVPFIYRKISDEFREHFMAWGTDPGRMCFACCDGIRFSGWSFCPAGRVLVDTKAQRILSMGEGGIGVSRPTGEGYDDPHVGSDRIIYKEEVRRFTPEELQDNERAFMDAVKICSLERADTLLRLLDMDSLRFSHSSEEYRVQLSESDDGTMVDVYTGSNKNPKESFPIDALKNVIEWSFVFPECYIDIQFIKANIPGIHDWFQAGICRDILCQFNPMNAYGYKKSFEAYMERALQMWSSVRQYAGFEWDVTDYEKRERFKEAVRKNLEMRFGEIDASSV